jgi:hypothetical protein
LLFDLDLIRNGFVGGSSLSVRALFLRRRDFFSSFRDFLAAAVERCCADGTRFPGKSGSSSEETSTIVEVFIVEVSAVDLSSLAVVNARTFLGKAFGVCAIIVEVFIVQVSTVGAGGTLSPSVAA